MRAVRAVAMITRLVMEQFLPFRDRVELRLDNQGLVLIKARNEVSAAADSNGSGKTSILHGVCWGLFGEDLRGRRADAVACRFTQGQCSVRLDMEDALGEWSVLRTRRPAGLHVSGIPGLDVNGNEDMASAQEKVEQRLGFGVRTFKNAVVFGQGAFDRFASADQAEQMRMLDEIQGVDFRDALARARDWRGQLEEQLRASEKNLSEVLIKADALARSIDNLTRARDSYEIDREARSIKLRGLSTAAEGRQLRAMDAIAAARSNAKVLHELQAEVKKLEELDATHLFNAASELDDDAKRVHDVYDDLINRLSALVEQGTCPSCRQPVKARQKAIRKLFEPELVKLSGSVLAAETKWKKAADTYNSASAKCDKQRKKLETMVPEGEDPYKRLGALLYQCGETMERARQSELRDAKAEVDRIAADIAATITMTWPGQAGLDASRTDREKYLGAEVAAARRSDRLAAAVKMAEYWVEAFGDRGIRSMLVDGVADFINERAAAHLEQLAAGEATLRMSAQTELKRGGARERISFTPEWSWGGSGAGTGSGGQDRRLDLALFAAVQDLAESRSARPFPIKIFDEPFDALDGRGKELAVEWVRRAARDRGTALLVTHSEELAALAEPDRTWTVVMGRGGARVEVS